MYANAERRLLFFVITSTSKFGRFETRVEIFHITIPACGKRRGARLLRKGQ